MSSAITFSLIQSGVVLNEKDVVNYTKNNKNAPFREMQTAPSVLLLLQTNRSKHLILNTASFIACIFYLCKISKQILHK